MPYFNGLIRDRKGPHRKGLSTVIDAAKQVPHIPIFLRSQIKIPTELLPPNITFLGEAIDNTELYQLGDVAIQPTLVEGTGLQLLETLSSGIPLITTNAPPMNELPCIGQIKCKQKDAKVAENIIPVHLPSASSLAQIMRDIYKSDISKQSLEARNYVETHHNWNQAKSKMAIALNTTFKT
jgi:glycosyltransferase involved in cell wall biosynthesis